MQTGCGLAEAGVVGWVLKPGRSQDISSRRRCVYQIAALFTGEHGLLVGSKDREFNYFILLAFSFVDLHRARFSGSEGCLAPGQQNRTATGDSVKHEAMS